MRILVIAMLLIIVLSLASALVYLVKDKGDGNRTVKALTWRIGLSLGLFLLLMAGAYTGLIAPGRM
ncbi:MAG: twin transmembrane helix small protein [Betaproteobacteria bacterium]|nr:twin transmembrane helix small protein [Betaproteobacteria bacterium]